MKRYRVWEANRKVFLWPENWLEPELRDDQSPFFKETMSELLQSDITEDTRRDRAAQLPLEAGRGRQAGAVRHPLRRGRHRQRPDDVVHVVARTAGANRKYYYRRREVRLLDAVGADQARHRGQPGDPGGLEGPPVPLLAADSEAGDRDDAADVTSGRHVSDVAAAQRQSSSDRTRRR